MCDSALYERILLYPYLLVVSNPVVFKVNYKICGFYPTEYSKVSLAGNGEP